MRNDEYSYRTAQVQQYAHTSIRKSPQASLCACGGESCILRVIDECCFTKGQDALHTFFAHPRAVSNVTRVGVCMFVCRCVVRRAEPAPRQQPGACRTQPYHAQAATAHAHGNTKGTSSLRYFTPSIRSITSTTIPSLYTEENKEARGWGMFRSVWCAHRSYFSSGERLSLNDVVLIQ